jgi:acyl-CoA synthetase (AMP-forming)/AMP-acid ligase II
MSPPRYATFRDAIEAHAARTPDVPFVLAPEPDAALTWKGLTASCDALAAAMERMDVKPGDVVGFMLTNGLSALTVFLGAMAGGYVVAPFNCSRRMRNSITCSVMPARRSYSPKPNTPVVSGLHAREVARQRALSKWMSMGSASNSPHRASAVACPVISRRC